MNNIKLSNTTPLNALKLFLSQQQTKKIVLKSIKLKPFRKIANLELNFDQYSKITAPNGSGKTSIMEAIYFVLSNSGSNGRKSNTDGLFYINEVTDNLTTKVKYINESYHIELVLQSNDKIYKLVRTKKSKTKNQIFEQNSKGTWLSLGEFKVEDYYKYINGHILNLESVKFLPLFMNPTSINEYEIKDLRTLFFISLMSKIDFDYSDYDEAIVDNIKQWDNPESDKYIADLSKIKDIIQQYKQDFLPNYDETKNIFTTSQKIIDNLQKQNPELFLDFIGGNTQNVTLEQSKSYLKKFNNTTKLKYPLALTTQQFWVQLAKLRQTGSLENFTKFSSIELATQFSRFQEILSNEKFNYRLLQQDLTKLISQPNSSGLIYQPDLTNLSERIKLTQHPINWDTSHIDVKYQQLISTQTSQSKDKLQYLKLKHNKNLIDKQNVYNQDIKNQQNFTIKHLDELSQNYDNEVNNIEVKYQTLIENLDHTNLSQKSNYLSQIEEIQRLQSHKNQAMLNQLKELNNLKSLVAGFGVVSIGNNPLSRLGGNVVGIENNPLSGLGDSKANELLLISEISRLSSQHTQLKPYIEQFKQLINPNVKHLSHISELIAQQIINVCQEIETLESDDLGDSEIKKPKILSMIESNDFSLLAKLDENNIVEYFSANLALLKKYFKIDELSDDKKLTQITKLKSQIASWEWLANKLGKKLVVNDVVGEFCKVLGDVVGELDDTRAKIYEFYDNKIENFNLKIEKLSNFDSSVKTNELQNELYNQLKIAKNQYEVNVEKFQLSQEYKLKQIKDEYEKLLDVLVSDYDNEVKVLNSGDLGEIQRCWDEELEQFRVLKSKVEHYFEILRELETFEKYNYFENYDVYLSNGDLLAFLDSDGGKLLMSECDEFNIDSIIEQQTVFDNYLQTLILQYSNYHKLRSDVENNNFVLQKVKEINIYLMNVLQKQISEVEDIELVLNSTNKAGTLKDDFTFIHNNTSQRDLSEGEKVQIGIKISKLFQKINSLNFPILIDEVNRLSFEPYEFVDENQLITFGVGESNIAVEMIDLESYKN